MTTTPPFAETDTAADLMLSAPKTLPAAATVADARAVLANPHVQMVLLADGTTFAGAITEIPDSAKADSPALGFVDEHVETLAPDASGATAFERAAANPNRRVIVLGDDDTLLGLLCLNTTRTHFCRSRD